MKYNEPIRPKGIGIKQVAFPVNSNYTEMLEDEDAFRESVDQNSTAHTAEAVGARILGLANSTSTASASSALTKAQNYPFEIVGISEFAMSGPQGGLYADIPFRTVNVINSNYYFDARTRTVFVNEAGWYFVRVFFSSTAIQGTHDWGLRVLTNVGSANLTEVYENFIDFRNTNKNPNVSGSTIVNLPNQNEIGNAAGRYGFKVQIYTSATFVSFTTLNTRASLQVFRLADLFASDRLWFGPV